MWLLPLLALQLLGLEAAEGGDRRLESVCHDDAPQHSGWLPAGSGNNYFYWLAESRSAAPHRDPLILWMTGGPGCASTLAALSENGPCKVVGRDEDGRWVTEKRRSSWTEVANVVWVDQPGGVGFSDRPPLRGLLHNETEVAANMLTFLRSFYRRFPHLSQVPLFIIGESYAGHYVPAVAARILQEGGLQNGIPLAGIGIGNGLVSPMAQFVSKAVFARTGGQGGSLHGGVVSDEAFDQMMATLPMCVENIARCQASSERDTTVCMNAYLWCTTTQMSPVLRSGRNPYDLRKMCEAGPPLCYNETLDTDFMNDPDVQRAFGLSQSIPWEACNLTVTLEFVLSGDYFKDFQPEVIELLSAGIGVLVYSGDDDFMVDWLGSRIWMESLPWEYQPEWNAAPNRGFYINGKKHGMVRSYGGLTFVQIYDAGHLVPMDQPQATLEMIRHFTAPGSPWMPRGSIDTRTGLAGEATAEWAAAALLASLGAVAAAVALLALWRPRLQRGGRHESRLYFLMA